MKPEEAQERECFHVTAAEVFSSKFLEFRSLPAGDGVIQHPFSANFPLTKHFSFPLSACSGGHYNPAVSLGAWLVGGLNMVMVIPYWLSQFCGGIIGASLAKVWRRTGKGRTLGVQGASLTR